MLTVEEVLRAGRDLHPSFNQWTTGRGPLLRFLSRYQRELMEKVADHARDSVQSTASIAFPLADFDAGATIPTHLHLHGGTVLFTNDADPADLHLTGFRFRNRRLRYTAYVPKRSTTITFLGREADWNGVASVELFYFPDPAKLTALADTFELPGNAENTLAEAAGLFLARREDDISPLTVQQMEGAADEAEKRYLEAIGELNRPVVSQVEEVW